MFGELEFWFSSIKVITLIGLILMGIIIDLGGNPGHDRIGFRYWKHPNGPMGHYLLDQVHSEHLSIFLGFWATLTNALFAYIGTELIGVTVGEAQAPRKNIPIAIRRTFFRIVVFYIGGVFVIGLIVPSTDNVGLPLVTLYKNVHLTFRFLRPYLLPTNLRLEQQPLRSSLVSFIELPGNPYFTLIECMRLATTLVGIKVLNHVINGCILLFVLSAANSDLYIASRTLYGLAIEGKAPRLFARVNRMGVPYPALILSVMFCGLVFLNVSSSSSKGGPSLVLY